MPSKNWTQFFADLSTLLTDAANNTSGDFTKFFADLAALLNDAADNTPTFLARAIANLKAKTPTAAKPTAADWGAFFTALAEFAKEIITLITPFFSSDNAK